MIITGKKFSKPSLSRVINGDVDIKTDKIIEKFRLDKILVEKFPKYNRSILQSFIKSGFVSVDGKIFQKPNTLIEKTARIELTLPPEYLTSSKNHETIKTNSHSNKLLSHNGPDPIIIYENPYVLVLDKPSGLLSMSKGEFNFETTLEDYGLLVHRLDRDTSGTVILGKDETTQSFLRRQFQDRKTHKTYFAIIEGCPKLPEAMIDLPIARNIKKPTTFIVDANGRPSQTYYQVIKTITTINPETKKQGVLSLVKLKPTTGRTHQLRVHLNYLGTPILGDRVYGNAKSDTKNRLYLHAKELEITIPTQKSNLRKTFSSPLPKEFLQIMNISSEKKLESLEKGN